MRTDEIRDAYLCFFASKGARVVPSDSLVPANDPTLLFTGAGMNQFKEQFLGIGKIAFRSAASCQKCLRTGDIMNVGRTPSHHTFFEMLGNFSFGDYFKVETISWAWEFLLSILKVPENRLRVSVHEHDEEAWRIWQEKIGLPADRIARLGDHDNFWPADAPRLGPNGPCGPCSEIFYDRGPQRGCGRSTCGIACECRRWVEIWNLVFTQYDRQDDGSLKPLPQKNIDTGMGLERMASCLQDTDTNMDIDIFKPIVQAIAACAGKRYGASMADDVLMRRIADHIRAVVFCIADGVLPANSHRGYVLKRLLRRAALDGRGLGMRNPFLFTLAEVVGKAMARPYPEVLQRSAAIAAVIRAEEEKFFATLEKGLTLIDMAARRAAEAKQNQIDGQTAFTLYDTYGFPFELAEEVAASKGLTIDRDGFVSAMAAARQRAREASRMQGDIFAKGPLTEIKKITADTEFLGYEKSETSARVLAIVAAEKLVQEASAGGDVAVVMDRTVFYGEAGGQVGDTGLILGAGNLVIRVEDTQCLDGIHLHIGVIDSGVLRVGAEVLCRIDAERRLHIRRNHTATHLLHYALRQVLGPQAEQKGSHVAAERLRFDYQHGRGLTPEEKRQVEEVVNQCILANALVRTDIMPLAQARAGGAIALFGEKYGETVRVVRTGDFSLELCGGTHMDATGGIGQFKIISEGAVAAGVRRIEAATGWYAYRLVREHSESLLALAQALRCAPAEIAGRLNALQEEVKKLRKDLAAFRQQEMRARLAEAAPHEVAGVRYIALEVATAENKELVAAAAAAQKRLGEEGLVILVGSDGERAAIVVMVGKEAQKRGLHAGELVKHLAPIIGGGGGGKADMAQAGGKEPTKIGEMLRAVPQAIEMMRRAASEAR